MENLKLKGLHHVAVICSDYQKSLSFYTQILGFEILEENYREDKESYKTDLALDGKYIIELFSFPSPLPRPSYPEACGLRHIAFAVDDIEESLAILDENNVSHESVRIDGYTGCRFVFLFDPDGLPIELYESSPFEQAYRETL